MSIINDALKKTQQNMNPDGSAVAAQQGASGAPQESSPKLGDERFAKPPAAKSGGPTTPPAGKQPAPPPKKMPKNPPLKNPRRRVPLLGIGLAAVILLALAAGLLKFWNQWPFASEPRKASSSPKHESPDGLYVSGIMTTGDKRVALINNEIYELGDIVNGMRIVEIEKDKIHLSYGDQQTKILKVYGN